MHFCSQPSLPSSWLTGGVALAGQASFGCRLTPLPPPGLLDARAALVD
jgi:hypothetical protein